MPLHKRDCPIRTLDEWHELARPKSENQWVRHRSAMEVARAWTESNGEGLPPEVAALFRSHPDFGEVLNWTGEPEARLAFDAFPGEPRNTDLAVVAHDKNGLYFLAVEAKADEPFAATVAGALASALERRLANPRSNGLARIEQLATALLGPRATGETSGPFLMGPYRVPGAPLLESPVKLYVGKVSRNLRDECDAEFDSDLG